MSKASLGFLFTFAVLLCGAALSQNNFKVIHSFSGYPNDTGHPIGPVVFDTNGNFYGAAPAGGSNNHGAIYELSSDNHGKWTETIVYSFCGNFDGLSCLDGAFPSAGLAIDAAGNLYGTTSYGGTGDEPGNGGGVAFELSPPSQSGGNWTESILYNFCSSYVNGICLDGGHGLGSQMIFDEGGNLYGTTDLGGSGHGSFGGGGVVFALSQSFGVWVETVIYDFCSKGQNNICLDGQGPIGGVTFDKSGNLVGTTSSTGNGNVETGGTLYELQKSADGWAYKLLASVPTGFQPSVPEAPVSFDSNGNLYSTLSSVYGGVFQRSAVTGKIRVLAFGEQDGIEPLGGVYYDAKARVLYGTNSGGSISYGNIFKIGANKMETVVHKFCSKSACADGSAPWATLVPDAKGNLYGTTEFGGTSNLGVVYVITP